MIVQAVGWLATAVFVASYFCRSSRAMRRAQMAGAALWMTYGFLIQASPVIVANLLVLGAAAWTAIRNPQHGSITPVESGSGVPPWRLSTKIPKHPSRFDMNGDIRLNRGQRRQD